MSEHAAAVSKFDSRPDPSIRSPLPFQVRYPLLTRVIPSAFCHWRISVPRAGVSIAVSRALGRHCIPDGRALRYWTLSLDLGLGFPVLPCMSWHGMGICTASLSGSRHGSSSTPSLGSPLDSWLNEICIVVDRARRPETNSRPFLDIGADPTQTASRTF